MSDGPYKSLPMSRSWKRLAHCAENENFNSSDTCAAANNALEVTWRQEVPTVVVNRLREVFFERVPDLFNDARINRIEEAAGDAVGYGLARRLTVHASSVLTEGLSGEVGFLEAIKRAVWDYAARARRQIEEHYCRTASSRLTQQVRQRILQAISAADFEGLARRWAGLDKRAKRSVISNRTGLDDGVAL
ncbi:hypothetical protein M5C97_18180 [Acidovorax sp. NCPPB 3859]|nr:MULTISPECIES: hypothetical protein [unclassified Acidovorax]MDA8450460.1 hypothetical protein [Acidovorax sp. GBBC 3297]MDA8459866.1 hypothetical protein [Acidovorax sp. GBBC 3333]MDA8464902.1 hypothetical protein [Acidovorax sp. GBBC 3332]MDA8469975.1 hypothetical protein [Acidovorax sp. GBBC 3299]WCM77430.1 hypothetical protein M5C94_18130 [Acidovorax sp. GBBC 712]